MKHNILLVLLFSFFSSTIHAQDSNLNITIGDVFIIGEMHHNNYKHINFPKPNIIIKKGGIASYHNIVGERVEVTSIKTKKNGTLVATLKLSSEKEFFNSHRYVTVDILKAISEKELLKI